MITGRHLKDFDWILFAALITLCVVGLAFIWSATGKLRPEVGVVHRGAQLARQIQWLAISFVAMLLVLFFDYQFFAKHAYLLYALGLAALLYVLVFGAEIHGAQRWIRFGGFQVQPSEFVKIAIVLALARYLMYRKNYRTLPGLALPFLLALVPMALIMKQPDLGTAMVLLPVLFTMLYAAGARPKHLLLTIAAGLAFVPVMWFFVMSDYQRGRILSFVSPGSDASASGYHIIQSLIAIGSGGLTGKGFSCGSQNLLNLLPAAHTDFIFAVIAEEWGLVGGLMMLALYFILFSRAAEIAAKTREPFGRLVVVGGLTIFAFQVLVNVGMTMRLCPITGLTLPFASYGGSSLLSSFIIVALMLNVRMRRKQVVAPDDFD